MRIEYIKGNVVALAKEKKVGAVAHGCNCFHTMGSGIAPQLNEATNGKLLESDKKMPYGDINNLGNYTYCEHEGVLYFNLYTQYVHGGHLRGAKLTYVHWDSFYMSMYNFILQCDIMNKNILAIPYIGCGLAGGDLNDFNRLLNKLKEEINSHPWHTLDDFVLYVVEYDG